MTGFFRRFWRSCIAVPEEAATLDDDEVLDLERKIAQKKEELKQRSVDQIVIQAKEVIPFDQIEETIELFQITTDANAEVLFFSFSVLSVF